MPLLALALQSDRLRPPTRWMLGLGIALITVALSYGAFMVATPPYMSLPLFLSLTRLFLIGLFLRAASELRANNGSGAST
jgi:CHASE2 domain-containing sensor protein